MADRHQRMSRQTGLGKVTAPVRQSIAGILTAAMLSGCAALGGSTEVLDTYALSAPDASLSGPRRTRRQLLITEPSALKILDGQNIVLEPQEGVIEFLSGAQWADRLPMVIQARLVETYQRSNRVGGVGRPGDGLAIDYRIMVDIRKFSIAGGGNMAIAELNVRVLNDRNGVVRATRTFVATSQVTSKTNDGYVAALDRAFDQAALEILDWSISVM